MCGYKQSVSPWQMNVASSTTLRSVGDINSARVLKVTYEHFSVFAGPESFAIFVRNDEATINLFCHFIYLRKDMLESIRY